MRPRRVKRMTNLDHLADAPAVESGVLGEVSGKSSEDGHSYLLR
jgi:hypothetical protein